MLHTTSSTPPSPSFALNEVEWTSDDESSSSNASSASRNDGAPVIRLTASHVSYRRAAVACEEERLARVNRTQDFVSHTQTERAHARHQANEVADRQGDLRRRVHHAAHKQEASQHTPSERHIADHEARTTHSLPFNAPIEAIELTPSTPYLSLPLPSSQSSSPSENGPYRPPPDPYWSEPARAQVEYDHAAGPSPVTVRPAATQQPHVRHHAPPQFDSPYWQPHPLHHSSDPRLAKQSRPLDLARSFNHGTPHGQPNGTPDPQRGSSVPSEAEQRSLPQCTHKQQPRTFTLPLSPEVSAQSAHAPSRCIDNLTVPVYVKGQVVRVKVWPLPSTQTKASPPVLSASPPPPLSRSRSRPSRPQAQLLPPQRFFPQSQHPSLSQQPQQRSRPTYHPPAVQFPPPVPPAHHQFFYTNPHVPAAGAGPPPLTGLIVGPWPTADVVDAPSPLSSFYAPAGSPSYPMYPPVPPPDATYQRCIIGVSECALPAYEPRGRLVQCRWPHRRCELFPQGGVCGHVFDLGQTEAELWKAVRTHFAQEGWRTEPTTCLWCNTTGERPLDSIKRLKERSMLVHIGKHLGRDWRGKAG